MKKAAFFALVALVLCAILANPAEAQFKNRSVYLGVNLTLATTPTGFGGDVEFALSPNFGLGGLVRYWGQSESWYGDSWSWSLIIPQAQGAYHFMPNNALDPYVGARLGYAIYSYSAPSGFTGQSKSDLYLTGCAGLRYFFTPNISGHGSFEFRLAGTDYVGNTGLVVGVDFTL